MTTFEKIKEQIARNIYSMLLETIIMVIICSYAIQKINHIAENVNMKIDTAYESLSDFSKKQGQTIDTMAGEITVLTTAVCHTLEIPMEDFQDNKSQVYQILKEKGAQGFKAWLEQRKTKEEQTSDE